MEASSTVPQIEKKLYHNNTAGFLGVVVLDHNGKETGVNVDPHGDIWLSDAEAILTARAPKRTEDNPFEAQDFVFIEPENGSRIVRKMRPLVLASDEPASVPALDRYVPGVNDPVANVARHEEIQAAAKSDRPENISVGDAVAQRTAEVLADASPPVRHERAPADEPVGAPPSTGSTAHEPPPPAPSAPHVASPPARTEPRPQPRTEVAQTLSGQGTGSDGGEVAQSWIEEPEAPGRVLSGALEGDNAGTGSDGDPTLPQPGDQVREVPQAAVQTPGAVEEEHAERVDPRVGEETGQARRPTGEQAQGEYASREEVGSPDAPAADEGLIG